ncbi:hypothetical protein [Nostoc sp.]
MTPPRLRYREWLFPIPHPLSSIVGNQERGDHLYNAMDKFNVRALGSENPHP